MSEFYFVLLGWLAVCLWEGGVVVLPAFVCVSRIVNTNKTFCKGHMDKTTEGQDHGWEVGIAGVGGIGGGKMEITILEQKL